MQKLEKSLEIKAPADRIFDYVTEPSNLPGIWPSMVEASNITRKADGWHSFDWVYKMAGLHFRGHARTVDVERPRMVVIRNEGGIPSTFKWTYTSRGSSTLLKLEVEYSIPTPVIGKLAEAIVQKMNEREAEVLLLNVKSAVEALVQRDAATHPHA